MFLQLRNGEVFGVYPWSQLVDGKCPFEVVPDGWQEIEVSDDDPRISSFREKMSLKESESTKKRIARESLLDLLLDPAMTMEQVDVERKKLNEESK